MAGAHLTSYDELMSYALRSLGAPVINIEVAEEQAMDRIQDAIEYFQERHYAGTTEVWEPIQVKQADIDRGYILVDPSYSAIVDLIDPELDGSGSAEDFENFNYRLVNSDFFSHIFNSDGVVSFHIFREKIDLLKRYFMPDRRFRYNPVSHRLELQGKWKTLGYLIVLHGYKKLDPDVDIDMFNEPWIKEYATALIGRQWGTNISKYDGVQLPGGVVMNGDKIYERYNAQVEKLEAEFSSKFELPVDFFIG
jgi:hypothetical protein